MPISRDARTDRRRRLLRDNSEDDSVDSAAQRRASRRTAELEAPEGSTLKRKAGYSQDVRKACGQRLVQLIPVRRRSFAAVIFISLLIPGLLLAAHYMIHVTGQLQWWRHPLAVAMDIGHPRSIAAWLSSQLWLLCLGATVLTFQLRRHKLDDYNGEYRLWFWLVLTCLIASVDATTNITELFAMALDPWAQTNLGWSGPAVVDGTMTVLIGMLGLRMCTELKSVPLSLVWWLIGLVAWGGSAALSRPEFRLELSAPIRYWLTAALWLGGLTMIWLAALTYLRNIYVEAQRRFLLRGRLAANGMPLGQRLRESLPNMPRFRRRERSADGTAVADSEPRQGSRWGLPGLPAFMRGRSGELDATLSNAKPQRTSRRRTRADNDQDDQASIENLQTSNSHAARSETPRYEEQGTQAARGEAARSAKLPDTALPNTAPPDAAPRRGLGGFLKGSQSPNTKVTSSQSRTDRDGDQAQSEPPRKSRFGSWLRRAKHSDDADEYRKVTSDKTNGSQGNPQNSTQREPSRSNRSAERQQGTSHENSNADLQTKTPRRWLPKLSRPKLSLPRIPRPKLAFPKFSRSSSEAPVKPEKEKRSLLSRLKLPSLSLAALKLQPPEDSQDSNASTAQPREMRPVAVAARPLPGTHPVADQDEYFDEDENDGRPLSKAERKRLRRNQQQRRSA